ncbi:MAG: site-2 protease family protein [Acidobacteria bacterium]|nr:site-2 protease family protein [Acidobacteriota bacterium]MDA1236468.1 site-2 protease family protein [Acidobacteriota bacterium]
MDPSLQPPSARHDLPQSLPYGASEQPIYRPLPARPKQKLWLHIVLYLATILTTTWLHGWQYSACLMAILTCHEFGHYFAAKKHHVPASLPYFIPSPFPQTLFGTFGAVIRMSPYIPNRNALFDIAAAGPIAGLVVALPVTLMGISMSKLQLLASMGQSIQLGEPLIFKAMSWWVFGPIPEGYDLVTHPLAFAGWVGMFVTALNLLPIGQLDGGHIVHSVFGKKSHYVSGAVFGLLALVTFAGNYSYMIFLVLLWFMGVRHPPTINDSEPLDKRRQRIAAVMLLIFILCFTPTPIQN